MAAVAARIAQVDTEKDRRAFEKALDGAFPLDTKAPARQKKKKYWWLRRPGDEE